MRRRGFDMAVAHFVKNPFDLAYGAFTDASYLFEPRLFFGTQTKARGTKAKTALNGVRRLLGADAADALLVAMDRLKKHGTTYTADRFLAYMTSAERAQLLCKVQGARQEVLSPGWNNTPRYGHRFTALAPLEPEAFGALLRTAMRASDLPPLLNAWNEWSEGAAIEPCTYLGRRYLDAAEAAADEAGRV